MEKVEAAESQSPTPAAANGFGRATISRANPRELRGSARRPSSSPARQRTVIQPARSTLGPAPIISMAPAAKRMVQPTATLRWGISRKKTRRASRQRKERCSPETTSRWESPAPRKAS